MGDTKAAILALLYRLEKSLNGLLDENPCTKITLVVLMDHSKRGARKKRGKKADENAGEEKKDENVEEEKKDDNEYEIDDEESTAEVGDALNLLTDGEIKINAGNPRISPDEKWTRHTNIVMMRELFEILLAHYPGRISKILIVKGRGKNGYYRDNIQGRSLFKKDIFKNTYQYVHDK